MHSHSIVARVWLATGVRVPCMGEDSVVAARHCFSAIPDTYEIHAHEMHAHEMHAYEMHAHELPPVKRFVCEVPRTRIRLSPELALEIAPPIHSDFIE